MLKAFGRVALLVAMLSWAALQGCGLDAIKLSGKETPPAPAKKEKRVAVEDPQAVARSEFYGRILGILESSEGRPEGLAEARRQLSAYVGEHPPERDLPEMALLGTLLDTALRLEKERAGAAGKTGRDAASLEEQRRQLETLAAEKETAQEKVRALEEENRELKSIVEQLRKLELDMEQKRRQLR